VAVSAQSRNNLGKSARALRSGRRYRATIDLSRELRPMMLDPSVREPLVAAIPKLRAFVISLGRDRERAEDLVQRTLGRACDNTGSFERGSNMDAWLCTILRNHFYSEWKRDRRASRAINILADTEATGPQQIASVEYSELCAALARLDSKQRDALPLVAVSGLTCGEAAGLCGCPVGTVKSRVNQARRSSPVSVDRQPGRFRAGRRRRYWKRRTCADASFVLGADVRAA
jgi:RNA polymerase sigma-70 factor, ECF subfamily